MLCNMCHDVTGVGWSELPLPNRPSGDHRRPGLPTIGSVRVGLSGKQLLQQVSRLGFAVRTNEVGDGGIGIGGIVSFLQW